jgi:nucleotide-binding universal stress UspA family protein
MQRNLPEFEREVLMMPFEKILFPVDFSDASEAMVGDVITMARRFSASVTLLHAFNIVHEHNLAPRVDAPFGPEPGAVPYIPALKELREVRQERLEEFVRTHFSESGLAIKVMVDDGDPGLAIKWAAKQEQIGLVMMATQGMGTFRRMLLGSLTAKVLHDLDCPVYTTSHEPGETPRSSDGFKTILCAVRMEPESDAALEIAGIMARAFGARVCLLHTRSGEHGHELRKTALGVEDAFERALGKLGNGGVAAQVRIVEAEVPEAVRQAALEEEADLVVVGRGHARATVSRIWSSLYTVIRESPCPVLSV